VTVGVVIEGKTQPVWILSKSNTHPNLLRLRAGDRVCFEFKDFNTNIDYTIDAFSYLPHPDALIIDDLAAKTYLHTLHGEFQYGQPGPCPLN